VTGRSGYSAKAGAAKKVAADAKAAKARIENLRIVFSLYCQRSAIGQTLWFTIVTNGDFMLHNEKASVKLFCKVT
jgi:hypothetical protein